MAYFIIMEPNLHFTRMTLRLPRKLREMLEIAYTQSFSDSVTQELIRRLEKSFVQEPLAPETIANSLKKHASYIEEIANQLHNLIPTIPPTDKKQALQALTPEERQVLALYANIPAAKQHDFLTILQMLAKSFCQP
jgi:DNA-binding NarL/FixJ family response regulator